MAKKHPIIKDPDLANVGVALERAAAKARQLRFDTNTPVYVYRDGKIVDIVAEHRKSQARKTTSQHKAKPRTQRRKRNPSTIRDKR